jgi:MFS family permease
VGVIATLRRRDFALLWIGELVSPTGTWAIFAALPFFVFERTGSALASGAILTVEMLPLILFGSVAGVFVDRWDRKKVFVWANVGQAVAILPMLLARYEGLLPSVYVAAFLGDRIGIVPPLYASAVLYAGAGLLAFVLLRRPHERREKGG